MLAEAGKRMDLGNLAKFKIAHRGLSVAADYAMRDRMDKVVRWQEKRAVASRFEKASGRVGGYLRDASLDSLGAFVGKALLMYAHANERFVLDIVLDPYEDDDNDDDGPNFKWRMSKTVAVCASILSRAPSWVHIALLRFARGGYSTRLDSECTRGTESAAAKCYITNVKRLFTKADVEAIRPDYEATLYRVFGMFKMIYDDGTTSPKEYELIEELERDYQLYQYWQHELHKAWPRSKKTGQTWASWDSSMEREHRRALSKLRADSQAGKAQIPVRKDTQAKLNRLRAMNPPALPHPVT